MTQQFAPTLPNSAEQYLDGNGNFSPILDPTQFSFFFDDFTSGQKTSANGSAFPTGGAGICWSFANGGATGSVDILTPPDSGTVGDGLLTTGGTNGNVAFILSCELVSGTIQNHSTAPVGTLVFDTKIRLAMQSTANIKVQAGWLGANPCCIEYDTSVPETVWTGITTTNRVTITGSTVNTSYHTLRIRSVTPGTILFSVDGGAEVSSSTGVPTDTMDLFVAVTTKTTGVKTLHIDYVWGWVALAR